MKKTESKKYTEFYPKFVVSPRWLDILLEAILTMAAVLVMIIAFAMLKGTDEIWDMVVFSLLLMVPLFLTAAFYKIRVYKDGVMHIFLCGFKRKVAINDIVKIVPVTISTRLHDLTYYDCVLKNGKAVRINVEDIDAFLKELKLHNKSIEFGV